MPQLNLLSQLWNVFKVTKQVLKPFFSLCSTERHREWFLPITISFVVFGTFLIVLFAWFVVKKKWKSSHDMLKRKLFTCLIICLWFVWLAGSKLYWGYFSNDVLFSSYTWRHHFLTSKTKEACKLFYYISKLVRALWLVNLAASTLLHGPLKFKFFCCCQTVAWFITKFSQLMKQITVENFLSL